MYGFKIFTLLASVATVAVAQVGNEQNVSAGESCAPPNSGCSSDMTQIFNCSPDGVWELATTCTAPYQCPDIGGFCVVA